MIQAGIARNATGLKMAAISKIMPHHIKNLESSSAPYLPIIQRLNPAPKLPKNRLIPKPLYSVHLHKESVQM
jgi:hypothetical protein